MWLLSLSSVLLGLSSVLCSLENALSATDCWCVRISLSDFWGLRPQEVCAHPIPSNPGYATVHHSDWWALSPQMSLSSINHHDYNPYIGLRQPLYQKRAAAGIPATGDSCCQIVVNFARMLVMLSKQSACVVADLVVNLVTGEYKYHVCRRLSVWYTVPVSHCISETVQDRS